MNINSFLLLLISKFKKFCNDWNVVRLEQLHRLTHFSKYLFNFLGKHLLLLQIVIFLIILNALSIVDFDLVGSFELLFIDIVKVSFVVELLLLDCDQVALRRLFTQLIQILSIVIGLIGVDDSLILGILLVAKIFTSSKLSQYFITILNI